MGTGEGAQAYGWGTYIAENPDVAKGYNVGGKDLAPFRLEKTDPESIAADLKGYLRNQAYSYNQGKKLQSLGGTANSDFYGLTANRALGDMKLGHFDDAIAEASRLGDPSPISRKLAEIADAQGNLYSVDIPDEKIAQMLDWDAPLSEQPESVRRGVQQAIADGIEDGANGPNQMAGTVTNSKWNTQHVSPKDIDNLDGASIKSMLQRVYGDEGSAKKLNDLGIPGIKYFDGNSRTAGKGTRNFVVFDENDMTVLTRNGEEIAKQADSLPIGKYKSGEKYHQLIPEAKEIPIDNIKQSEFGQIIENPERYDFTKPIEVSVFGNGEMKVSDGHHRLLAAKQLGMKKLPVKLQAINAKGEDISRLIGDADSLPMDEASRMARAKRK